MKTKASRRGQQTEPEAGAVRSMTGYGRATVENGGRVTAEVRAVNGRFFKLNVKVLGRYAALEERIKTLLAEAGVKRGNMDVSLFFEDTPRERKPMKSTRRPWAATWPRRARWPRSTRSRTTWA